MNEGDRFTITSCNEFDDRYILLQCSHDALGRAETGQSSQEG